MISKLTGVDDNYFLSYAEIGDDFKDEEFEWNQTKSALKFAKEMVKKAEEYAASQ